MKDIVNIILDIAAKQAENKKQIEEATGLITTAELRGKEVAYQEILEIIDRA